MLCFQLLVILVLVSEEELVSTGTRYYYAECCGVLEQDGVTSEIERARRPTRLVNGKAES